MKIAELREMSDEQLELTAKEAAETFFGFGFKRRRSELRSPAWCGATDV